MAEHSSEHTEILLAVSQKLDAVAGQVQELNAYVQDQRRRQQEWDELKQDLAPAAMDLYRIAVEQLDDVESYVQLEDLLHLARSVARNTRNIQRVLDQMQSMFELADDAGPILNSVFLSAVQQMDALDRKGYFRLLREGQYVLDNVTQAFGPEDVRQLGDNVVAILTTIKEMTQPEIMSLAQNMAGAVRQVEVQPQETSASLWSILKQLRDPHTRRGLAMTLEMLKTVGSEHAPTNGAAAQAGPARDS
jgi:uncharacterized protein YjgD (DUF1641 family)